METRSAGRTLRALIASSWIALLAACAASDGGVHRSAPTAAFSAAPTRGPAPLVVTLDAHASTASSGVLVDYAWDFGNGATGNGASLHHVYADPGTFTARLTVTDAHGATATAQRTIEVTPAAATGTVTGALRIGAAAGVSGRHLVPSGTPEVSPGGGADAPNGASPTVAAPLPAGRALDVVPGEVIVKFRPGTPDRGRAPLWVGTVRMDPVRPVAALGAQLYRGPELSPAATVALARTLASRSDVAYAQPNYLLQPLATPNDPWYRLQWHYPAIGLPAAWDITTGSPDVVVAVLDTGILHRSGDASATHPDLVGRVLDGYDFISNPQIAGDGDGRDPDPYDVGDQPGGQSSYHGSHVAGTIAAATDDGIGVAGVDWQAKVLPVRVLGIGGGSLLDVVEGTLWAVGFDVAGVPTNLDPAHVVNLSLGGPIPCSSFEQEAFDLIASSAPRQAVVVVAAGNAGVDASGFTPAGCRNVITVGATEFRGHRASYSNYGPGIDVMAPGGDGAVDLNGDGYGDGVLSLYRSDGPGGGFGHAFMSGTSMAAPHVAGVVALMKALDPTLRADAALALLTATARPSTAEACGREDAGDCGAGLIDAAAALAALRDGQVPVPDPGAIVIEPNVLDFGADAELLPIVLTNVGSAPASWTIGRFVPNSDNPGAMAAGSVYVPPDAPAAGTLAAGETASTTLGIDRGLVEAPGAYQVSLMFEVDGAEQALDVRFRIGSTAAAAPAGRLVVAAFLVDGDALTLSGLHPEEGFVAAYGLEVLVGDNLVIAWTDEDGDGEISDGDFVGAHPTPVMVASGASVTGVDIVLERVVGTPPAPPGGTWPEAWQLLASAVR
jgi:serine protease